MKIEITRCLDLRYKSKNNTYPVCIRLYYNRRYDYIKTGVYLTQSEYEDLYSSKIKSTLKESLKAIVDVEDTVTTYLDNSSTYDIKKVRTKVINSKNGNPIQKTKSSPNSDNIFDWFEKKIGECKINKQFGSAESYESTKNVYKDHLKMSSIEFRYFTVEKLKDLETTMMDKRHIIITPPWWKSGIAKMIYENSRTPCGAWKGACLPVLFHLGNAGTGRLI